MFTDTSRVIVIFPMKVLSKHFPYILYCIHKLPHTSLFTKITLYQKVMHTINIRYTHTHII